MRLKWTAKRSKGQIVKITQLAFSLRFKLHTHREISAKPGRLTGVVWGPSNVRTNGGLEQGEQNENMARRLVSQLNVC